MSARAPARIRRRGFDRAIAAAPLLVALATAVSAQTTPAAPPAAPVVAPAPTDPAPCRALLAAMPFATPTPAVGVTRPAPDTCVFTDARYGFGRFVGYSVDTITLQGLAPGGGGALQPTVRVQARGIRFASNANPTIAYMNKVGATPFDIDVDLTNDRPARRFTLRQFAMRGEAVGTLEIAAELTDVVLPAGLDAASLDTADVSRAGLLSLSIHLANHGFVEHMVVPALAGYAASMAPDRDPEPVINAARDQTVAAIRAMLPPLGIAPDTTDALARFVSDFPHPSGSMRCTLAADPPLVMPSGGDPDPAILGAMLAAAHPACTYEHP